MKSFSSQIGTKEDNTKLLEEIKKVTTLFYVSIALHVVTITSVIALAVKVLH